MTSGFNLKRPKPGETLEDLIELEKSFLEENKLRRRDVKPAATAVRVNSVPIPNSTNPRNENANANSEAEANSQLESPKTNCFTGCIVENNAHHSRVPIPSSSSTERKSKFKMDRLKRQERPKNLSENQSTCSDVMKKVQKDFESFDPFNTSSGPSIPACGSYSHAPRPHAAGDTSIGEKIHPLLAGYSEDDILKARDSILKSMKPETREILAKRRAAAAAEVTEVSARGENMDVGEVDDADASDFPVSLSSGFKNMPHMDTVESEKLEWTKPVTDTSSATGGSVKSAGDSSMGRSARFALDGRLMTKELESNPESWNKGLHHHGEEMDRAGYTIEELFTLSRSIFPHQRTFGLNVLAEIFHRAHYGEFDSSLDPSIFHACNELDFIHVLRTGADFRDSLSLNASINCLAALLFPEQEELCLDIAFNWPNAEPFPWLAVTNKAPFTPGAVDLEEEITESDLKDFQYVKNDLLEFLIVRTNGVIRLNYILNNMMGLLNESGVHGILKILIRIGRHSPNVIMDNKELLQSIQKHFMSPNWSQAGNRPANMSGIPLSLAVKLFRILASSNSENATKLYNEFYLFPSIMSYLAFNEWGNQNLVMNVEFLVLESSNLWEMFLNYGLGIQEYMSFFPVMMSFFQKFCNRDALGSFDLTHAARLYSLLGKALTVLNSMETPHRQYAAFKESVDFVSSSVVKLLLMIGRESTAQLLDQDLCLLALMKGLECLSLARKYERFSKVDSAILKYVESSGYRKITRNLISHSLLLLQLREPSLDPEKEKSKYPSNFISCGTLLFGGFQTPILDKGSPFTFLTSLLRYTRHMHESDEKCRSQLFDDHSKEYLHELGSKNIAPRINAFLRFELYCVRELFNLLPVPERLLPISKILHHVQTGDESLAEELLGMFFQCIGISEPQKLSNFYAKFLFIPAVAENPYNFKQFSSKVVSDNWILEPLNVLYHSKTSESQLKPQITEALMEVVKKGVETTLGFVIFCLKNCDGVLISSSMDIPALYTRIVLVFMMGNQLFLEPKIRTQLKEVLNLLISSRIWSKAINRPIFSKYNKVEGFPTTFSAFYSELLQEFGANSFGDDVFGGYLMLPLRSSEDTHIKSLFWNDQAVRFLRTRVETSPVPLEYFTSVHEKTGEMIQTYRSAIHTHCITTERNPLLHAIISFHLSGSRDNKSK